MAGLIVQGATCSTPELSNITLKEFVLWLLGRRQRLRVVGNSMLPLLRPDDEVLIDPRAYGGLRPDRPRLAIWS